MANKIKYKLAEKLTNKGFPWHDPEYHTAHEEASKAEKKQFGTKSYNKLKKMDETLPLNELIGKNYKWGKIKVSKKVPPKYRQEVAYHEQVENEALHRIAKKTVKKKPVKKKVPKKKR